MFRSLALLLPALVPSWRFFQTIEASPRIEFAIHRPGECMSWQEFQPPPDRLSPLAALWRLFWSPGRNEALYLVSCAERIVIDDREHAKQEILNRIRASIVPEKLIDVVQYRITLVQRVGDRLEREVVYTSPIYAVRGS
ncbi:MAG: hypothetical protein AAF666_10015 [Pseudomonadota bacterium]